MLWRIYNALFEARSTLPAMPFNLLQTMLQIRRGLRVLIPMHCKPYPVCSYNESQSSSCYHCESSNTRIAILSFARVAAHRQQVVGMLQ